MSPITPITLITITRNDPEGLARTMASVNAQTHRPVRHIIVNGGHQSIDYPDAEVIPRRPRGVYDAINRGLNAIAADDNSVVGLLHSGDVFAADDVLERIAQQFDLHPHLSYLWGDVHFADVRSGRTIRYYSGEGCGVTMLKRGMAPPHPSLYMRNQVAKAVGPYATTYKVAADFDMFVRLFSNRAFKGKYLPIDAVSMEPGGLSSRWFNRLWRNNRERQRSLRSHGIPAPYWRMMLHYKNVLTSYLCRNKPPHQS